MSFPLLKMQIETTTRHLEQGTIQYSDRVFLNHVLEQIEFILDNTTLEKPFDASESLLELLGSTNELIEDGLDD